MTGRLDGRFAYIPSPEGLVGLRVYPVADACSLPDPPKAAGGASATAASGGSDGAATLAAALAAERHMAALGAVAGSGAGDTGARATVNRHVPCAKRRRKAARNRA